MKQEHKDQIGTAVKAVQAMPEINHFYFVACGGSMAFMKPAEYLFDREITIPASVYSSNEFVHRMPKALNQNSVVITCSHSGNTPETVEATKVARKAGAVTIALSHLTDSPLWEAAEYPVHYDWGPEADASDLNKAALYSLIFQILNVVQPNEKYVRGANAVEKLQAVTDRVKAAYADFSKEWGRSYKREPLIYTMGSGANYGEAYSFAICLLMEMQWVNASAIHSGEYFHGPFEITDFDVPFIIIKGLGATRPLDERAHNFCQKYSDRIAVIDAAEFDLTEIDEDLREYYCPLFVGSVLRQMADALAYERGHELSVRRYMWRMEY